MARDGLPWLKIGCLTLLVLPVLAVLLGVAAARLMAPGEAIERTLVREVPTNRTSPTLPKESSERVPVPETSPGTVKLNLTGAELYLKASPAGSPITVRAAYDGSPEDIRETFSVDSGSGWVYEVEFHTPADSFSGLVSSIFGGRYPEFIVTLPVDTPIALELSLSQGGGLVDLGSLWLTTVDLNLLQGGLELEVSKPLAEPLQRFESIGSMGGVQLRSMGNASPRRMEITQRMGGIELDLRGQWRHDAKIDLSVDMGGGALRLPDDVVVTGLSDRGIDPTQNAGEERPVLDISTSVNMGEVEVIR